MKPVVLITERVLYGVHGDIYSDTRWIMWTLTGPDDKSVPEMLNFSTEDRVIIKIHIKLISSFATIIKYHVLEITYLHARMLLSFKGVNLLGKEQLHFISIHQHNQSCKNDFIMHHSNTYAV